MTEPPVLTAKQMAEFLMTQKKDYRIKSLYHFERIHEPSYAIEVKQLLETLEL